MAEGNLPEVETREIPGFGGFYRAGIDGSVWSRRKRGSVRGHKSGSVADRVDDRWRQVFGRPNSRSGHIEIRLKKPGGEKKLWKVHHFILWAFVGPAPDGMECRHLNGKPADNRLDNLKWGTRRENVRDSIQHGTFAGLKRGSVSSFDEEEYSRIESELPGLAGMTLKEMASHLGVPLWLVNYIKYRRKKERVSA